jgi:fructuronate reductase
MKKLSASTVASNLLVCSKTPKNGIVHIGMGNFHRAHLAVYTAKAVAEWGGDWGIIGYSFKSRKIVDALKEQDLLYSVLTIDPNDESVIIPAIHTSLYAGRDECNFIVDAIAHTDTKIITLTVTEAGYLLSQTSGGLDLNNNLIQVDLLESETPQTMPGLIVRGLLKRFVAGAGPLTILSCDNLSSNGDKTKRVIIEFSQALESRSEGFLNYLTDSITYPNSMVDRIVPNTEDHHLLLAQQRLGVIDSAPVPAEAFTMWVLEDNFAAGRPDWASQGAIFTNQVEQYEVMKLRLLNGAHSLISYLGALSACATIPQARFTPYIERAVTELLHKDYLPTFSMPEGLDADFYISQLFARWANTVLADKTSRVGSDGSSKLPQRVTEPAIFHLKRGRIPTLLALTVAAYLVCIAPKEGFNPGEYAALMSDPKGNEIRALRKDCALDVDFVQGFFESGYLQSELLSYPEFVHQTQHLYTSLMENGVEATVLAAI